MMGPGRSLVCKHGYLLAAKEVVLFEPPLSREVTIEQVAPSNCRLLSDELVITFGVPFGA